MHSTSVFGGSHAFGGAQTIDWLLDPIREFAATAERDHYAGALVLALVTVLGAGALMRTFFNQRAKRLKDLYELEMQRLRGELEAERRKNENASDNDTLERIPQLLKLMFEQAGQTVAPQFNILNQRLGELIAEQKRNNDLTESNSRQRAIEQRQLLDINRAGFNDLGVRLNDKLDDVVNKVGAMKDEVIQNLGKQIEGMVEDIKSEVGKMPEATAKAVLDAILPVLNQHKEEIQTLLEQNQTRPMEPTDPAQEPPT